MSKILAQVPQVNERTLAPEDICRTVAADFKARRISHADAAKMLNVKTRSVSNQISGKRPFGKKGAQKYAEIFGYEEPFLLYGIGPLKKEDASGTILQTNTGVLLDEKTAYALYKRINELEGKIEELTKQKKTLEDSNRRLLSTYKYSRIVRPPYEKRIGVDIQKSLSKRTIETELPDSIGRAVPAVIKGRMK